MSSPHTFYVCEKCGAYNELHAALATGWLIKNRRDGEHGLIIRCPACRRYKQ